MQIIATDMSPSCVKLWKVSQEVAIILGVRLKKLLSVVAVTKTNDFFKGPMMYPFSDDYFFNSRL